MAENKTRKIRKGDTFEIISEDDFDPAKHDLLVDEGEIVVKPLNVEGAKPFVIAERDFDPRSYDRVNLTKAVSAEIATQQERQTAEEEVEARNKLGEKENKV